MKIEEYSIVVPHHTLPTQSEFRDMFEKATTSEEFNYSLSYFVNEKMKELFPNEERLEDGWFELYTYPDFSLKFRVEDIVDSHLSFSINDIVETHYVVD